MLEELRVALSNVSVKTFFKSSILTVHCCYLLQPKTLWPPIFLRTKLSKKKMINLEKQVSN